MVCLESKIHGDSIASCAHYTAVLSWLQTEQMSCPKLFFNLGVLLSLPLLSSCCTCSTAASYALHVSTKGLEGKEGVGKGQLWGCSERLPLLCPDGTSQPANLTKCDDSRVSIMQGKALVGIVAIHAPPAVSTLQCSVAATQRRHCHIRRVK